MDSKTAEFLTKLMLEDDEDDVVFFAFPNEKRKIKCSISMLTEISPVFEAMFSTRWHQEKSIDNQQLDSISQDKTIQLDDGVTFNQYLTFKLLMQILYGLRQIDSLSVDQATGVYFYANKYQIKDVAEKIKKLLNKRMETGISKSPFTFTELKQGIEFAQLYQLDDFKNKLDKVKLDFNGENPVQFWDLVNKFEMEALKQQLLHHLKTIVPKADWGEDILLAVIGRLQADREDRKKTLEALKCDCDQEYSLYCYECDESLGNISEILSKL